MLKSDFFKQILEKLQYKNFSLSWVKTKIFVFLGFILRVMRDFINNIMSKVEDFGNQITVYFRYLNSEDFVDDFGKFSKSTRKNFTSFLASYSWLHFSLLIISTLVLAIFFVTESVVDFSGNIPEITELHTVITRFSILAYVIFAFYLSLDLNVWFFLKLGISYLISCCVSYFLLITQNLNNFEFDPIDFENNIFFEAGSFQSVAIILGISVLFYIIKYYTSGLFKKFWFKFKSQKMETLCLSLLVSLIVIQDSKLIDNLSQYLYATNEFELVEYYSGLSYKIPLIIFTVSFATYSFWSAIKTLKKKEFNYYVAIVVSFILALTLNYGIQYGIRADESFYNVFVFSGATLFQIMAITVVSLIVYAVFNRFWIPTLLLLIISLVIDIANEMKYSLRGEPLLLTDLSMISDLDLILGYLNHSMILNIVLSLSALTFLIIFLQKYFPKQKLFNNKVIRIFALIMLLGTSGSLLSVFRHQEKGLVRADIPVVSRLNNNYNIMFSGYASSARFQSVAFLWLKQLTTPLMEVETDYSQEKIELLIEKYKSRAKEINKERDKNLSEQTVIFILSESLADPRRNAGVKTSEEVLKNIKEIQSETTSGIMKSDAYGGGTANIETQTLLGLPMYNLSSSIGIYNVQVVPKLSVVPSISDYFSNDNKYFVHLGDTKLYSRLDVYSRLGFENFITNDRFSTKPAMIEKYGGFPSDQSTYQNVLESIKTDENQFFNVITYQNHIPWSMGEPSQINGEGDKLDEKQNEQLSHYSRLLWKTDQVTKEFLNNLSKIDKDITVVFYGDHLPGLYSNETFEEIPENRYFTDYFIWSNKNKKKLNYPKVNSSDFPAAVLAHTNSKVTPYYALLTDVLDFASVDKNQLTPEQQEIADDLRLVQYDLLSGNGYLKQHEDFFRMEKNQ